PRAFATVPVVAAGQGLRVGATELRLGGGGIEAGPTLPTSLEEREVQSGAGVQAQVANRALGNARTALVGLGGSAAASTLAIVYLATQRTLAGRRHAAGLLLALGQQPSQVRSRAALEGALLGGAAMALAIVPAKLAFLAAGHGPPVFAHALPDPITPLFAVQAAAAFAAACALAAYWGSEALFRGSRPLQPVRRR
ncbi:MAG TPA: hypothetical protein VHI93_03715, partial [Candidatus Thermoplasmatota archaeon]|nr:hypothetical protein [Candidatus Thermoplasmatota archaeon]